MYCNHCGAELPTPARFCQQCGRAVAPASRPLLERPRRGRKIAGVCLGLARHFDLDPTVVRLIWVLTIFVGGGGLIAYLVAWLLMPEEPLPPSQPA